MINRRHALVSLTALAVVACASPARQAVQQATGVQTNQKGDTVQIKGQDGTTVNISSQLPDELKSFPVPPGFKPDSSSTASMSSGGDKLAVASWKGSGTLDSVAAFYKSAMPSQGWTEVSTFASDSGSLLTYSKGDQNNVTITASKESDGVTISVMLGKSAATPTPKPATSGNVAANPTSTKPEPTDTPVPPKTTDATALPDEMKALPVPGGFAVIQGSTGRVTDGGKFVSADARWFGKTDFKQVADFYRKELAARGWTEQTGSDDPEEVDTHFTNDKAQLGLALKVSKTDAGTEVTIHLDKVESDQ